MATTRTSKYDQTIEIIHSTYLDNPFLPKEYVRDVEALITQDENYYRIYALGEWGLLSRRIYTNYKVIPELPDMSKAKWSYGLDFGLVNPSTLIKVYLYQDRFYVEERLYRTNMTNLDIIEFLSHEERGDIYGDPSAKILIEEIRRAGFSAFEGHKGVKEGIDLCQRQTLLIPESSANLIKEIRSYQWKTDRAGRVMSEPVKFNDHAVDAMRYAIYGITERYGFATRRPFTKQKITGLHFRRH